MSAPHSSASSSRSTPRTEPPALWTLGRTVALGLLCALIVACGPQSTAPTQSAGGEAERFRFIRGKMGIVRIDTSSGQVWTVPLNGDGGWAPRGEAPDLADRPARFGRFDVMNIVQPRNVTRLGKQSDPVLIRVDRETGRSWLLETEEAQSWVAIRDTGEPAVARSTPAPAATAPPAAGTRPSGSRVLDEGTADQYPILTGDQLGVTPEEKQETLATLRAARTKEGLPQKMRVWSVRQLGQVDPDLAVPELLEVLGDEDPVVVVEAITQLGQIGRASTIPRILTLKDHPDPQVREAVSKIVVEVQ